MHCISIVVRCPGTSLIQVNMSRRLFREYGVLVGISSGANMMVALEVARKYGYGKVVTVLPDRVERYLSMNLLKG